MPSPRNSKKSDEKFKRWFLYLVAAGFIIAGINGMARTYCTTLPAGRHPDLIRSCLNLTSPGMYITDFLEVVIGIVLIYLEKLVQWRID